MADSIEVSVHTEGLERIVRALGEAADGKILKGELAKELRKAVGPAVAEVKASVLGMATSGHAGESLRRVVAAQVKSEVRLSGKSAGVRVVAKKRGMPRNFGRAPRYLNRARGWRHPVFGNREAWVHQVGKPGWFDEPLRAHRAQYRAAVESAMGATAARITRGA